jgi:hypothetical protein
MNAFLDELTLVEEAILEEPTDEVRVHEMSGFCGYGDAEVSNTL